MEDFNISQIMLSTLQQIAQEGNVEQNSQLEQLVHTHTLSEHFAKQENAKFLNGLKLVLGPTGIGKTNGIKEVIRYFPKLIHFYIANRKNLLRQMAEELDKAGIPYVWIKSDIDLLADQTNTLSEFLNIFNHPVINIWGGFEPVDDIKFEVNQFRKHFEKMELQTSEKEMKAYFEDQANKSMDRVMGYFKKLVKDINKEIESLKEKKTEIPDYYLDFLDHPIITGLFPYLKIINKNAPENVILTTIHKGFYGIFNGKRTIQLTEINNALMFLDEFDFLEKNLTEIITSELDIPNPLILVDYFYHNHLSKAIDFEEFGDKIASKLYKKITGNIPNKYLPKNFKDEQIIRKYKDSLLENAIISRIESLNKAISYEYPQIKEFILSLDTHIAFNEEENTHSKTAENNPFIFSTAYSISVCPLFLKKTGTPNSVHREFEIVSDQSQENVNLSAYHLFLQVTWIARDIMNLLKDILLDDSRAFNTLAEHYLEDTNYIAAIAKSSYQRKGKDTSREKSNEKPAKQDKDVYKDWSQRSCVAQDNNLKNEEELANLPVQNQILPEHLDDSIYRQGFALYEIKRREQIGKPNSVKFQYFSMHNTPEYFISQLALNNLVFGISATANMERLMNHFDLKYFREKLGNKFYEQNLQNIDLPILTHLIDKKASIRNNDLTLHKVDTMPDLPVKVDKKILKVAKELSKTGEPFENQFGKTTSPSKQFLLNRAKRFFDLLENAVKTYETNPELAHKDTHLVFFYSFKQIKALLKDKTMESFFKIQRKELNPQAEKEKNERFPYYNLFYKRDKEYLQNFIIVFFDARKANVELADEETFKRFEKLFWQKCPVIVITTYASMANGVNLQFFPTEKAKESQIKYEEERKNNPELPPKTFKEDFRCLHLLDIPYHFLTVANRKTDKSKINAQIKKNIWYLTKLRHGEVCGSNQVSDSRLFSYLKALRTEGGTINEYYRHTDDYVIQSNALFFQAIGRTERVWNQMPDQHIWLYSEVYGLLEAYIFKYKEEYTAMKPFLSDNLKKITQQIEEKAEDKAINAVIYQELQLEEAAVKGKQSIQQMLSEIAVFQKQEKKDIDTIPQSKRIDFRWLKIRRHLLRHDMKSKLLKDLSLVFSTKYFDRGVLCIQELNYSVIPYEDKGNSGVIPWDINKLYNPIRLIPILREYFRKKGYPLAYAPSKKEHTKVLPTPYAAQALLTGAIGEEATKATFNHFRIWSSDNFNHQLFEVVDLKLKQLPIYIDAKNWRPSTFHKLSLKTDDLWWNRDMSNLESKAVAKYAKIIEAAPEDKDIKLVYINLMCHKGRYIQYFGLDKTGKQLDVITKGSIQKRFQQAQVIFIPGLYFLDNFQEEPLFHYDFLEFLKALTAFAKENGYLSNEHIGEIGEILKGAMLSTSGDVTS